MGRLRQRRTRIPALNSRFKCQICLRCFSSNGGLTRHVEDWKGHNRVSKSLAVETDYRSDFDGTTLPRQGQPPELANLPSSYNVSMTTEKENDDPDTENDDFFNDPDTDNDPDTGNDEFFNNISNTGSWYTASTSELFSEGRRNMTRLRIFGRELRYGSR